MVTLLSIAFPYAFPAAAQVTPGPLVTFKDPPSGFACVVQTRQACVTRDIPRKGPVQSCETEAVSAHFTWDKAPRSEDGRPYYRFELGSSGTVMPATIIDGSSYDVTFETPFRNASKSFWLRKVDGTPGNGSPARLDIHINNRIRGEIACSAR
jgi:hypothetical protein